MPDGPARRGRWLWRGAVVVALAGTGGGVAVGRVAAADGGEALAVSGAGALAALLLGTALLMVSVEVLIHSLVRTAVRYRVSAFLLAVVFSGVEFDNIAFGVFTGFKEMQDVAFGLAIGNAISIFGLTLALGALAYPFALEVPREYVALMIGSPLLLVPFLATGGFTAVHGLALVGAYGVIFAYVFRRERRAGRTFMQSREVREAVTVPDGDAAWHGRLGALGRRDWFWPLVLVAALGGVVVGAEVSATGVEGVMETWDLDGTLLGLTAVTLLYTVDDLLLIFEPLRLGYYDVAVGGVVGSLLFFVTANVGIVSIVGDITTGSGTLFFHFPALLGACLLAGYFLWRGEVTRRRALALLAYYIAYLAATAHLFSVLPVGE